MKFRTECNTSYSNNISYQEIETKQAPIKKQEAKLYINTLMPSFNYIDHLGNKIYPKKCCLL